MRGKGCATAQLRRWKRPGAGALTLTTGGEKRGRLLSPGRWFQPLVLVETMGDSAELCFYPWDRRLPSVLAAHLQRGTLLPSLFFALTSFPVGLAPKALAQHWVGHLADPKAYPLMSSMLRCLSPHEAARPMGFGSRAEAGAPGRLLRGALRARIKVGRLVEKSPFNRSLKLFVVLPGTI